MRFYRVEYYSPTETRYGWFLLKREAWAAARKFLRANVEWDARVNVEPVDIAFTRDEVCAKLNAFATRG